jgi:chromosome segregation ATPase
MDNEKRILNLLSENEFLQEQLEDLNRSIEQKDQEIALLADSTESEASLRSRIEGNRLEIAQIQHDMQEATMKATAIDKLNEELENNLLQVMRARQSDKAIIKELVSTQTNINILHEELNETTALYKKVKVQKSELAELKSERDNLILENTILKESVKEMEILVDMMRTKKIKS